jgi:MFS family permease
MAQVLRRRDFALIWSAQLISSIGDWVVWIALPFYVYGRTGSALATGTMFVVETLPPVLLGSLAGVLVDQWDRKRTMVIADLTRCLVFLLLPVIHAPGWFWVIYPLAFVQSAVAQFFSPAQSALIPTLVGKEHLLAANTLNSISGDLTMLVGPALGGVLYEWLGLTGTLFVDSASFLISGVMILLVSTPPDPTKVQAGATLSVTNVWRDWLAGLSWVKNTPLIATLLTVRGLTMLGQGIINVLWVAFVREILKGSALEYGGVQVAVAAGGLVGALIVGRASKILPPGRLVALSEIAIGLILMATFNLPSLPVILALQVVIGIPATVFSVTHRTLLQASAGDRYLGRVFGALSTTNALLILGGEVLASLVGDHLGIVHMLNVSAGLNLLSGVVALVGLFNVRSVQGEPVSDLPGG